MKNQPFNLPDKPLRLLGSLFLALLITACSSTGEKEVCPPCSCPTSPQAEPEKAAVEPLQPADWDQLPGWRQDSLSAVWPAFMQSCKALAGKGDPWKRICAAAGTLETGSDRGQPNDAAIRAFIEQNFQPWQIVNPDGSDQGVITGYYEPLLHGSRQRSGKYRYGIYSPPDDLLVIQLSDLYPQLKGMRLRGRLEGNKIMPYWSRAELDEEKLQNQAIAWVEDPIELFFLQIQGSGRILLPSGETIRVGYADQNGHPYQSIGRILVQRGELKLEEASMQGIQAWARTHPDQITALLNSNPSYVFFTETKLKGGQKPEDGPSGALGVPLTPGRSIAVDPRVVTLGTPVFLATTEPLSDKPMQRLMMAQDTGGAIKGAVRADFFWGFGAEAATLAGRMRQQGRMWLLLPK